MSETAAFLREQEEEDRGVKCRLCTNDLINAADLESHGMSGLCSRCACNLDND
jgi:hypothetical protein